jgi:hypothetical protein
MLTRSGEGTEEATIMTVRASPMLTGVADRL